jgi:hypothetical protein
MRVAEATIINTVLKENNSIDVTGLRFTFNISKKGKTDENQATIKIYNMSPESRKLCETVTTKLGGGQTHIELRVGYGTKDKPVVIFRGLSNVVNTYTTPDWITEFRGLDGSSQYRDFEFEKSYPAGTAISTIVKDIADASGTKVTTTDKIEGVLPRGRALSGPAKNTIENLQSKYGFEFDVQDEETVVGSGKSKIQDKATVTLARYSGMIGEPQIKGAIVLVSCLLNPAIRPGAIIFLDSLKQDKVTGNYLCKKVNTTGDSWGGQWTMTLELEKTGAGPAVFIDDPQTFGGSTFA